ncbi:MAG TPA: FCD domain-containing protein, partial [Acidimicrobiia bacterium]|nr:FCD domain-containing protein [Acidimicrobiia bacterium]
GALSTRIPLPTSPVRNQKVGERVAQQIAAYILDRGLSGGDMLPNEKDMAAALAVSRTTLREGLRLLETQGIIVIRTGPGGGPIVRTPRPADLANSASLLLQFMDVTFSQVIDSRAAVEPEIARLAALHRTDAQVDQLAASARTMAEVVTDPPRYREQYAAFHELMGYSTGNGVLAVFAATQRKISEVFQAEVVYGPKSVRGAVQSHNRLVDAIRAQDAAAAQAEATAHFRWYRSYIERRYPTLLDRPVRWTPT